MKYQWRAVHQWEGTITETVEVSGLPEQGKLWWEAQIKASMYPYLHVFFSRSHIKWNYFWITIFWYFLVSIIKNYRLWLSSVISYCVLPFSIYNTNTKKKKKVKETLEKQSQLTLHRKKLKWEKLKNLSPEKFQFLASNGFHLF